jgi:hypothetical protein
MINTPGSFLYQIYFTNTVLEYNCKWKAPAILPVV